MKSGDSDASLRELVPFLCRCGHTVRVTRWFWIDAENAKDRIDVTRRLGPFEGECEHCGRPALARAPWLLIEPSREYSRLVLWDDHRGDVPMWLQQHLDVLRRHPDRARTWLLRPEVEVQSSESVTDEPVVVDTASVGRRGNERTPSRPLPVSTFESKADGEASGVPEPISADFRPAQLTTPTHALGTSLAAVRLDDDTVIVSVRLPPDRAEQWRSASLSVRPVHLRDLGYPLVGVRIVGSYVGEIGCIDGLLDAASGESGDVFRALARRFIVRLEVQDEEDGSPSFVREVAGRGLERNAAMCLESGRGALRSEEHPPEGFAGACRRLAAIGARERLAVREPTLAAGAYAHLVGAREILLALEHLDNVSTPEHLARVLEIDGLPAEEYEEIRRRILEAALEHGLCAPRRFWRRVISSGMARDLDDYATKLAQHRAADVERGDDLDESERASAWAVIRDLCRRNDITPPLELREALGMPEPVMLLDDRSRPIAAAGEIGVPRTTAVAGQIGNGFVADSSSKTAALVRQLADPRARLNAATELLAHGSSTPGAFAVVDALETFEAQELIGLTPALAELGSSITTRLLAKLESERREVRQIVVILLGLSSTADALDPLVDVLVREPTRVWVDVARSIGSYGAAALDSLCAVLERVSGPVEVRSRAVERVARAMAEIAIAAHGHDGRTAVEQLAREGAVPDPRVCAAARLALDTLKDVRDSAAQARGELPVGEQTEIRSFTRRAFEAILVPELDGAELDNA